MRAGDVISGGKFTFLCTQRRFEVMGCCICSRPIKFDMVTNRTVHELGLSKFEIRKLCTLFHKVDTDGNGVIQANEFFSYFSLQPSLVNKLLFSCYDMEGTGEM